MPESYRPHLRKDDEHPRTTSQSVSSNTTVSHATVQDVLDKKDGRIITIHPEQTLHDAVVLLRDNRIGALLCVDEEGKLAGILSERDIVRKLADQPGKTLPHRVEEVMTRTVETCTADEPLVVVLRLMTEGRFRHMPVVDGDALIGMITIGDVVHFRLNQLELEALQIKQLIVG
ncbi:MULTISPECIES: CBS domain-containing protein [Maritimibacter]|jgi:CBS domain-containing protein|uniref:CBS domain protein n=1 Tax=Maritimibacter alkaliphilus HTCC2654 TaxID=314271 RepID=A3VG05_9RHOB|nr:MULTISPECIES: CBS domain-containing protein [Maritimibacter]EAQ12781.1 CBS domain protein [Rhodobacterales bacterium HTCC2654] [Maritimibacter alkaliphilus HTCC2654]MBL6429066.1 CBS domain-containing protein [Maritimibacter sp.]TYP78716.1 CBS domain-containing protein [Maritimibacter alkaliphilus HTCC2654]